MTDLSISAAEGFATTTASQLGDATAVVLTVTILLGFAIFFVFKAVSWTKGGIG